MRQELPDSAPSDFPIESNDSEQVLTVAHQPHRRESGSRDFGEAAPFTKRSGIRRNHAPGY